MVDFREENHFRGLTSTRSAMSLLLVFRTDAASVKFPLNNFLRELTLVRRTT